MAKLTSQKHCHRSKGSDIQDKYGIECPAGRRGEHPWAIDLQKEGRGGGPEGLC